VFVLVIGGGKVGYYLTKELIDSGHEVVLMEKDKDRANQIADEIGSIVISHDGCEGKYLAEAGANRADIVAAVTGDDEDNLVICQMAKHHFDVPRTIARVNNPKNEDLFRHLGVDEIISPTRMILGSIEQDIPVHELLHLAALGESDLEIIEARLQPGSPAVGRMPRDLEMPTECALFAIVRDGHATPLRPDTVLAEGDKVLAIGRSECEVRLREQLIGDGAIVSAGASAASSRWAGGVDGTPADGDATSG
jgi:trk system potassium uptake protein